MKPSFTGFAVLFPADRVTKPIGDLSRQYGWDNPHITGPYFRLAWNKFQPGPDVFDFTSINQLKQLAQQHGKRYTLALSAGDDTPQWVYSRGATAYESTNGRDIFPLPWDPIYQSAWFQALRVLASVIGPDPNFTLLGVAGFSSMVTMYLGTAADETEMPCEEFGFATVDQAYLGSTKLILDQTVSIFPDTEAFITYAAPFPTDTGRALAQEINDYWRAKGPARGISISSRYATLPPHDPPKADTNVHGSQFFQPALDRTGLPNGNLYHPILENPPAYPQPFDDCVRAGLSVGDRFSQIYQVDASNPNVQGILPGLAALLKANIPTLSSFPPHDTAH